MLNSLFGCERSTRPLRSVALSSPKVSILPAFFAFSTFVMSLLLVSSVTGQTTIWMENFEDETTSSATSSFAGNNWSATSTGSGTMSILNGPYGLGFEFDNTPNATHTCTWTSEAIDITGYTVSSGANASSVTYVVSGSGGSPNFSHNVAITGNSATITITIVMPNKKSRIIDSIELSGTCTPSTWYADDDGDGLGDSSSALSACSQPAGYVADLTDLCDDTSACNYDANSNANASCQTNDACGVCGGTGVDVDSDGVCDDVDSCTDTSACNYTANPTAACSFDAVTWYEDADGDGLGDPAVSQTACSQPAGYVDNNTDDDPTLNPGLYAGTVLYPGDVYFSYAAEGYSGIGASHIAFTLLKDVVAGTKLVLSPSLQWAGDNWITGSGTTAYEWTAPADGVAEGTEVILYDIQNTGRTDGSSAEAKCDTTGNLVRRNTGNTNLEGGVQCGTYRSLTTTLDFFTWVTPASWIFQPDTAWDISQVGNSDNDGQCRHLTCLGFDLEYANPNGLASGSVYPGSNTGTGTLIAGSSWGASMDPEFSFEDNLFYISSQWSYSGGSSPIPFTNVADELSPVTLKQTVSFSAAGGSTPSYTSTVAVSITDYSAAYADLDFNPNGCISLPQSIGWDALTTGPGAPIGSPGGSATLNITVDNSISLSVDVADAVACNDINVTTGAFAACDGMGRELSVNGDIALGATATFDGGAGTLKMAGLTLQTLDANNYSDPTSTKVQLNNLQVLKNKVTKVSGHVRMKPGGAMTFDDLAVNDELALDTENASSITFESDGTSGTSAIGPCAASNYANGTSQEFTFQRYIPADPNGSTWVNIGAYVTGTTVADWTSANSNMLIFKYEESNYGSLGSGWTFLWDGTTSLSPGSGYMAMLPAGEDALISVTGAFQIGDVNVDLTFTDDPNQSNTDVDGWNLVSNPYPAPVNLAQVLSGTGISTWYIFDNVTTDGYVAGGSDAPSTLGVGQSFWVKVSTNTTLTFTEADKIISDNNTFVRDLTDDYQGTVGIEIANGGYSKARAFVKFQEGTSEAFDAEHDALMFNTTGSNELRVWMASESGEKLSRQAAGRLEEAVSVPLTVTTGSGGTLVFTEFPHPEQPENLCVTVLDTETGEMAQMGVDSLVVEGLPGNTLLDDRFVLHFNGTPSMTWVSSTCDGLIIDVEGANWETWNVSWEAEDGSQSGEGLPYELEDGAYTFVYDSPESGCMQDVAVTIQTACLGDFNLNGERDVVDLLFILSGLPGGLLESDYAEQADCDCDGLVTINDMLTFLTVFAMDCE